MKRLLACAVFLLPGLAFSQGIRKNFTEMTTAEKTAYNAAVLDLYNSDPNMDLVQNIQMDYWYYFDDVYGDLSSTPCESNIYLPFNRVALWEMDNALQRRNPRLTVPYWDFTVNNTTTDSLFTFLNQYSFPSDWNIQWYPGGNPLPTASDVQSMQNAAKFCDDNNYSNSYNDQMINLDYGVSEWVGGSAMVDGDPIYSVYHAMLDKLWQKWQMKTGTMEVFNPLDRYDGATTSPFFSPLPYVSTNSVLDSRTMGFFYSDNDTALLDGGYNVSNTYMTPEYFSYPKQITVGNFNVPSGKSAILVSQKGVNVNPGFALNNGHLEIDIGSSYYNNFPLSKAANGGQNAFDRNSALGGRAFTLLHSPQGIVARVWVENPSDVQGYLMSVDGKIVSRVAQEGQLEPGYHEFALDVPQGRALYFAYFRVGSQTYKQLVPRL